MFKHLIIVNRHDDYLVSNYCIADEHPLLTSLRSLPIQLYLVDTFTYAASATAAAAVRGPNTFCYL